MNYLGQNFAHINLTNVYYVGRKKMGLRKVTNNVFYENSGRV